MNRDTAPRSPSPPSDKVDPRWGMRGSSRGCCVKSIVRELGGEKIDIIRYVEGPKEMAIEALKPAIPWNVDVDRGKQAITDRGF